MSAELQERLDAIARLGDLARASEDPVFRDYASHVSSSLVDELDVLAGVKRLNKKIVDDYGEAITALWLTRRACRSARSTE